jgi:hypothetical protein
MNSAVSKATAHAEEPSGQGVLGGEKCRLRRLDVSWPKCSARGRIYQRYPGEEGRFGSIKAQPLPFPVSETERFWPQRAGSSGERRSARERDDAGCQIADDEGCLAAMKGV